MNRGLALMCGAAIVLGACDGAPIEHEGAHVAEPAQATPSVDSPSSPGIDALGADVLERARAAFFVHDDRFVAGFGTHRAEIERSGESVRVTPIYTDAAAATIARSTETPALRVENARLEAHSPLSIRTESIARGELRLDTRASAPTPRDGRIEIARGVAVERIENTRAGVEQSWRFESAPAGDGDLIVAVATDGMQHFATTESGVHFVDPTSELMVRYGHATFIDARGIATHVPVELDGSRLIIRVDGTVIDEASYPAVLDPVLSPEVAVDTPIVGSRGGNQLDPQIASDGTSYILVFEDQLFGDEDVRAARFNATGALIDSTSFEVAVLSGSRQLRPAVTFNGASYVVAWQDGRSLTDWDIYGTIVSTSGIVATPGGAVLVATGNDEQNPDVDAAGATTLLALHAGDGSDDDVLGIRLDVTAAAIDAGTFVIGGGAGVQDLPKVVAAGSRFLVTFDGDTGAVSGVRVRASGTAIVDTTPIAIATASANGAVAWDGASNFLATWVTFIGSDIGVMGTLIPVSGPTVAVLPVQLSPSVAGRSYFEPSAAHNGSEFLVAYTDATLDAGGNVTSATVGSVRVSNTLGIGSRPDPTSIVGDTAQASVTNLGSTFYVAYVDYTGLGTDIRGTRVNAGTVSTPAGDLLTSGPNNQSGNVIASDGTSYLIAWVDFRNRQIDVWGARMAASGSITGSTFRITDDAGVEVPTGVAWDGTRYVLTYETADNIRGVMVSAGGVVAAPFDIDTDPTAAAQSTIACAPTLGCLVAFTSFDRGAVTPDPDIIARRIDTSSIVPLVGARSTVEGATGTHAQPAVAASNTQFLIAWTDASSMGDSDVRGAPFGVSVGTRRGIGTAAGDQYEPAVASDGTEFLVAFVDERAGGAEPRDIYFQRMSMTGTRTGSNVALATSAEAEVDPAVGFSGSYLVGWTRGGTSVGLEGSRVQTDGTIIDTAPLAITDGTLPSDSLAIAGASGGAWGLAYRAFDALTARIRARVLTDERALGEMCGAASECASGFCVDGVCCENACAGGTSDCNACSVAAGGTSDGMCTPISGCGTDAGADGGAPDGGALDGGAPDGGAPDGGAPDGGAPDGGVTDGGVTDTGTPAVDTGPRVDTGAAGDTSVLPDGGMMPTDGGCGCSVPRTGGSIPGSLALFALVGLALVRRRR